LQTIADATGFTVNVVRDHKQRGYFNPDDMQSVAHYIETYRAINEYIETYRVAQEAEAERKRKEQEAEDNQWGGIYGKKGGGS